MGMHEQVESEDDKKEHAGSIGQSQSSEPETEFPAMGMPEQIESEDDEQEHVGSTRQNQSSEPETEFPEKDDEKEHVGSIGQNQSSEPETEFPEKACSNDHIVPSSKTRVNWADMVSSDSDAEIGVHRVPIADHSHKARLPVFVRLAATKDVDTKNAKKAMPKKKCQERKAKKEMSKKKCQERNAQQNNAKN